MTFEQIDANNGLTAQEADLDLDMGLWWVAICFLLSELDTPFVAIMELGLCFSRYYDPTEMSRTAFTSPSLLRLWLL